MLYLPNRGRRAKWLQPPGTCSCPSLNKLDTLRNGRALNNASCPLQGRDSGSDSASDLVLCSGYGCPIYFEVYSALAWHMDCDLSMPNVNARHPPDLVHIALPS